MEKKNYRVNDGLTLEMDGRMYRLVKNNLDICIHCPFHKIQGCGELCRAVYYKAAETPSFGYYDAIFVEVTENKETTMEEKEHKNEPDYKALYEEEHKKYEDAVERAKGITSNMTTLQSIREHIFPELAESEEEKLSKKLHECVCRAINNDKLPYEERKYISEQVIPYLENLEKRKEQKPAWSEEDEKHIMAIDLAVNRCMGKWNCCGEICPISEHNDWLKSIKGRVQSQPRWNEEDEMMLECVLDKIGDLGTGEMCKDWLKALKKQMKGE